MVELILTVLIVIVVGVGFLALTDFVRVRFMHYRLDASGLDLVGVLWRPKPIPYWQIESARVVSWLDLLLDGELSGFNVRWYTTRTLTRHLVVVRHRDGRMFMLTPDDPGAFVRAVTARIAGTAPPRLDDHSSPGESHLPDRISDHHTAR